MGDFYAEPVMNPKSLNDVSDTRDKNEPIRLGLFEGVLYLVILKIARIFCSSFLGYL